MTYRIEKFGWLRDPPDYRDYKIHHEDVQQRLRQLLPTTSRNASPGRPVSGPAGELRVDLRPWCSPIEDQGQIGSCTANATVGALEYFERKTRGEHVDASRLFLYRVTRRYLGWEGRGDTGAFIRSAIKALRLFGALPERYFPYNEARWDAEPEAFHYAFAQNFKALEYYRLDGTQARIREALDAGLPVIFGFTCYSSLDGPEVARTGIIPFPGPRERVVGGHAVLAVGYSDSHVLIRNSWGTNWGDNGYGYLPWTYFDASHPLADDTWVLVNASWVADDEADRDFSARKTRRASSSLALASSSAVAREGLRGAPERSSPRASSLAPLVKVVQGLDPIRNRTSFASALRATAAETDTSTLVESGHPVSLYLKKLKLKKSFDFQLWWKATNELYMLAIVWDLSGKPPRVFPPADIAAWPKGTWDMEEGETLSFVGDGIQLWPSSKIRGGLYVRLVIMENDDDVRRIGERIAQVHQAINGSQLPAALAGLAAGVVSAPVIAAVGAAASVLTGVIANALQKDGDDVVAVFDGTYGAEGGLSSRTERYEQSGAEIELELRANT